MAKQRRKNKHQRHEKTQRQARRERHAGDTGVVAAPARQASEQATDAAGEAAVGMREASAGTGDQEREASAGTGDHVRDASAGTGEQVRDAHAGAAGGADGSAVQAAAGAGSDTDETAGERSADGAVEAQPESSAEASRRPAAAESDRTSAAERPAQVAEAAGDGGHARAREPAAGPRGGVRPWFGDGDRGLGIAGTARRPGAPGTHVVPGPEVRRVPAGRTERPVEQRIASRAVPPPPPPAAAPATESRRVRHVGTAQGGNIREGAATEINTRLSQTNVASWPARTGSRPAHDARQDPGARPVRHVGSASTAPQQERAVRHVGSASPAVQQYAAPQPEADANGERPVVRVSISQAAAAGNQTVRPLAPTVRNAVPTVQRPTPAAAPQREKPRKEVAPAEPLAIPDEQSAYLTVEGLGTPACVSRVERMVGDVEGVQTVEANLAAGLVAVAPESADRAAVEAALTAAGHPARPGNPDGSTSLRGAKRAALFAGATAAVGLASWAAGHFTGSAIAASVVATGSLATGWPVVGPALRHLARGRLSAELLPLAAALATLVAAWIAPGPSPALAALPLAFHLAVAALATLASARAQRLIERLRAVLPTGDAPKPGSRIELAAGTVIPADGRLLAAAVLDERPVGGDDEVERLPGEAVAAGTVVSSDAVVEITSTAPRSRIARGLRVAQRALATHPTGTPAQLAGRIMAPVALAAAAATWVLVGPWAAAALLAGSAPLALGLSASLASAAGVTRAVSHGVAVRSSQALERAARTRVVLLDKSTTLTRGDAAVLELLVRPDRDAAEVLGAAAAIQAGVDHGISRALTTHARELRIAVPEATDRIHARGLGTSGKVAGRRVTVGSAHHAAKEGIDLGLLVQQVDELARRGRTPLVIAFEKEAVAVLGIAETPRESARQAMGSLELLELELNVASGDATASVQWLAEAIGLDKRVARGDLSPEHKKALVDELRTRGPCLVAGASPVDASALAAADIAVAASTDPAVEAVAGALLLRQDPQGVVELIRAGRATRRGRNLATAAGLLGNAGAMTLAATGAVGVAGAASLALVASLLALGAAASPWISIR